MIDRITYCADIEALKAELVAKGYYVDGEYNHGMVLTPIVYNGVKTLSLVRGEIVPFDNIEILGTYDEIFADPILDAKYKSVYPYDVPVTYIDEDGIEQSYLRPKMIGAFA